MTIRRVTIHQTEARVRETYRRTRGEWVAAEMFDDAAAVTNEAATVARLYR